MIVGAKSTGKGLRPFFRRQSADMGTGDLFFCSTLRGGVRGGREGTCGPQQVFRKTRIIWLCSFGLILRVRGGVLICLFELEEMEKVMTIFWSFIVFGRGLMSFLPEALNVRVLWWGYGLLLNIQVSSNHDIACSLYA